MAGVVGGSRLSSQARSFPTAVGLGLVGDSGCSGATAGDNRLSAVGTSLLANVAAAGLAPGAVAGAGAANAGATARYSGDHMDIERIESPMKKFLSVNCADTNATVLQNTRTFLDHVSNAFKTEVCLYGTRDDVERLSPDAVAIWASSVPAHTLWCPYVPVSRPKKMPLGREATRERSHVSQPIFARKRCFRSRPTG